MHAEHEFFEEQPAFSTESFERGDTSGLAKAVGQILRSDGDLTVVPGFNLHRRHKVTEPMHCVYGLGIGVTLQGRKQVMVGDEVMTHGPGQCVVTSVDLPVIANVSRATTAEPFLGMTLTFENDLVMQVMERMQLQRHTKPERFRPVTVQPLDVGVLQAFERLVRLLEEPDLMHTLAPLIKQEIIVRLLNGPSGAQLRHVISAGTPRQHITEAVASLKLNFRQALRMDDLAEAAHMSPSTFRQHFRAVTGMSPLQYQKQLRLQAARQLMLIEHIDASSAGGLVGYESSSQFSREYSRLFGEPPQRDIKRLKS
ncbi:AraC family transcriptional regulator [Pseudomonas sp. P105]|uniref:AraC family transcriptional regulator n=1 Tax=Pseudomonas sp. P105 TaxID=3049542 RepID=UPI00293515ED|nr:AraC family transcriptional regulator [Pseudomonas sp. P105]WNZ80898.1 AraC family transcriptional regulator [Pseudomonas sp. P105]